MRLENFRRDDFRRRKRGVFMCAIGFGGTGRGTEEGRLFRETISENLLLLLLLFSGFFFVQKVRWGMRVCFSLLGGSRRRD